MLLLRLWKVKQGRLPFSIKDLSSRPLPCNKEDKDMREGDKVPLSFDEEFQNPTLVEEKNKEFEMEELSKHLEEVVKVVPGWIVPPIEFVVWDIKEDCPLPIIDLSSLQAMYFLILKERSYICILTKSK